MKPLTMILGVAGLLMALGWTWSELPRKAEIFIPTWSRSHQLYGQPHAVWLDQYDRVGANLPILMRILKAAGKARQIPEIVVYSIPMRDLGQSSEGGFGNYEDYLADNRLNADLIRQFVGATGLHPVIYLEPDSIPLAVQYRRDHAENEESRQIYADRMRVIKILIGLYQGAGGRVYLEAGHSGWFDYGEADIQRIADALNEFDIRLVEGLATNVSNRQPVGLEKSATPNTEYHYLQRLLPLLDNQKLDIRVDTSRNGGPTKPRQYYLSPDGQMYDNETPTGRWVGQWGTEDTSIGGETWLKPLHGKRKALSRLLAKEKYTYKPERRVLTAPAWLDAVGDVQLGPAPTDHPPAAVADLIRRFRYIKPPDDCDGALNCPPGASKTDINAETARNQPPPGSFDLPTDIWLPKQKSVEH